MLVVPQEGPDFRFLALQGHGTSTLRRGRRRSRGLGRIGSVSWMWLAVSRGSRGFHVSCRWRTKPVRPTSSRILSPIRGSESSTWHWDIAWAELLRSWDGVLLGVMFDSAYYWINAQSRRLARMSPRFMVVDICMPMDGSMLRGRPEVGPVNMPMSTVSLDLVRQRCSGVEKQWDVSFIGVLYPHRVDALESYVVAVWMLC